MCKKPHNIVDFSQESRFQSPLTDEVWGETVHRKQKGTPQEKGALAGIFRILGCDLGRGQARPR